MELFVYFVMAAATTPSLSRQRSRVGVAIICVTLALTSNTGSMELPNCPTGCNCNDETLLVLCESSNLNVLPILLNPATERLVIRDDNIRSIDSAIQFYTMLKHLDLSHNRITKITDQNFLYQTKLEQLYLANNKISAVSKSKFQGLTALKILNLKRNFIEELSNEVFSNLPRLEELNLSQNRISTIEPDAFIGLRLKILYLDDNELTYVPTTSLSRLHSLIELNLGLNAFSNLPDNTFASLNRLSVLDLSSAQIFNISENAFNNLTELKSLNLYGNRLSKVPMKQIKGLTKLEELNISRNDFGAADSEVFELHLKQLNLTVT